MDNEMEAELINIIKYTTHDNRDRTIVKFISLDKEAITQNDKFKGISIIENYYDGFSVFDKIPLDLIGKRVILTLKKTTNPSNPLLQIFKVTKINDIDLV